MKKVLISLALSILCLVITIGSFLTNDVTAYKEWAMQNSPRVMEKFDRHFGGMGRELPPPPGPRMGPPPREGAPRPPEGQDRREDPPHHDDRSPHHQEKD